MAIQFSKSVVPFLPRCRGHKKTPAPYPLLRVGHRALKAAWPQALSAITPSAEVQLGISVALSATGPSSYVRLTARSRPDQNFLEAAASSLRSRLPAQPSPSGAAKGSAKFYGVKWSAKTFFHRAAGPTRACFPSIEQAMRHRPERARRRASSRQHRPDYNMLTGSTSMLIFSRSCTLTSGLMASTTPFTSRKPRALIITCLRCLPRSRAIGASNGPATA
jgi:hypothetical protein